MLMFQTKPTDASHMLAFYLHTMQVAFKCARFAFICLKFRQYIGMIRPYFTPEPALWLGVTCVVYGAHS